MAGLREALEAKYDELDAEPAAEPVAAPEPAPETPVEAAPEAKAEPAGDRPRDETGRFVEAPKKPPEPAKPAEGMKVTHPPVGTAPPTAPIATPLPGSKAPQALKPAARELWAKLPPEFEPLKAEWARRERETAVAMQRAAEERKSAGQFQEAVRPYEILFRQAGVPADRYVGDLLRTADAIVRGPAHVQADTLAGLILQSAPHLLTPDQQDANGNPSCPLDRALVAKMQGRAPAPQGQGQYRDPRVDQLLGQIQEAQRRRELTAATEAENTANSFASTHEFLEDVRDEMADILEVWGKRGKTEVSQDDLERAYTIACQNNSDVAPLLEQRRAAEAAQKALASTARSRAAASSVRNEPAAPLASQPADRRAVLEAKWDELNTR